MPTRTSTTPTAAELRAALTAAEHAAPTQPADFPDQRYYRAGPGSCMPRSSFTEAAVTLFRFANDETAALTLKTQTGSCAASLEATLTAAQLLTLHAALGDALRDLADLLDKRGDAAAALDIGAGL